MSGQETGKTTSFGSVVLVALMRYTYLSVTTTLTKPIGVLKAIRFHPRRHGVGDINSPMMTMNKASWLPLRISIALIAMICDFGLGATTTLTLAIGRDKSIGGYPRRTISVGNVLTMPIDKTRGFALFQSVFGSSMGANRCLLPATAVAITVWDFVCGRVRGMLNHVDKLLSAFGHSLGRYQRRGAISIGFFQVILAQMSQNYNRELFMREYAGVTV